MKPDLVFVPHHRLSQAMLHRFIRTGSVVRSLGKPRRLGQPLQRGLRRGQNRVSPPLGEILVSHLSAQDAERWGTLFSWRGLRWSGPTPWETQGPSTALGMTDSWVPAGLDRICEFAARLKPCPTQDRVVRKNQVQGSLVGSRSRANDSPPQDDNRLTVGYQCSLR